MKKKNQSLSGLSAKDKIMECFEKDVPRKEIWKRSFYREALLINLPSIVFILSYLAMDIAV